MYYYKTKRLAVVLILSVCVAGGLYRSAHSLSFTPPEIHKTLLHGQIPEGWHAHYSRSSLQAVQNALTQKLHRYYNQEMGIRLYWEGLQPDYKITVDYTEKLDHSLSIRIQAQPRHGTKQKVERYIRIASNASLLNLLEAEVLQISQHLAKQPLRSSG